jgi:hypothetical protein
MLEQERRSPMGLRRFLDQANVQVFLDGRVELPAPGLQRELEILTQYSYPLT